MQDPSGTFPDDLFHFQVNVYSNLCIKGFNNVPADGEMNTMYVVAQHGDLDVTFTNLDNTSCRYTVEMYADAGHTTQLDPLVFTLLQQPAFTETDPSDNAVVDVNTYPAIRINTSDLSLISPTPTTVYIKLISTKNSIDTLTAAFSFDVTFVETSCSSALALDTSVMETTFNYKIGSGLQ